MKNNDSQTKLLSTTDNSSRFGTGINQSYQTLNNAMLNSDIGDSLNNTELTASLLQSSNNEQHSTRFQTHRRGPSTATQLTFNGNESDPRTFLLYLILIYIIIFNF